MAEQFASLTGFHEHVFWTILERPKYWLGALAFHHADTVPFYYWRKRKNVPRKPASMDAVSIRQLEQNLNNYFPQNAGRGENCKVDSHDGLSTLVQCVGLVEASAERVISVLLYYGFEVRKNGEETVYIYDVNYDIEMLRVRIRKWGGSRWPFGC